MRYLLHETQREELKARQQYLYDVFKMYFIAGKSEYGFIIFNPVGTVYPDILFITGHTDAVKNYLKSAADSIPEKTIVITSCMGRSFRKYAAKKDIYVPNLTRDLCLLRDGRPYGFEFKVSDAELTLYNSSGTILERIRAAYARLI